MYHTTSPVAYSTKLNRNICGTGEQGSYEHNPQSILIPPHPPTKKQTQAFHWTLGRYRDRSEMYVEGTETSQVARSTVWQQENSAENLTVDLTGSLTEISTQTRTQTDKRTLPECRAREHSENKTDGTALP